MSESEGAAAASTASGSTPSETLFSRRHKEKLKKATKTLEIGGEKSEKNRSPRSPITLKIKRTIHHPYTHVSTPKPNCSSRRESKSSKTTDPQKFFYDSQKKSLEKVNNGSSSQTDSEMDLQHTSGDGKEDTTLREKKIINFKNGGEKPIFHTPSEEDKNIYDDLPMLVDETPSSEENTFAYQSAENSPLNVSKINIASASNLITSSVNSNIISATKISETRESEKTPKTVLQCYYP